VQSGEDPPQADKRDDERILETNKTVLIPMREF
jgi:hypothetical protein